MNMMNARATINIIAVTDEEGNWPGSQRNGVCLESELRKTSSFVSELVMYGRVRRKACSEYAAVVLAAEKYTRDL